MFSLGLGLRIEDFRRVFSRRLSVAAGLLAQTVLLPITAFAVCVSLDLPGEIALGVMILSACPGGVTSGMVTRLARGDTALSISLSALTSALAFVTVPVVLGASLWFFADRYVDVHLPVGQMVGGLIAVTLAPVALGVWLRESGRAGARFATVVYRAATAVFATIVLVTFVTQWPNMTQHFSSVGPACLLLNGLTMTTGAVLGYLARLPVDGRLALAMECGMQNSALGITLAVSLLNQPALAVPSVVYAPLMNLTAFAVIAARRLPMAVGPCRADG